MNYIYRFVYIFVIGFTLNCVEGDDQQEVSHYKIQGSATNLLTNQEARKKFEMVLRLRQGLEKNKKMEINLKKIKERPTRKASTEFIPVSDVYDIDQEVLKKVKSSPTFSPKLVAGVLVPDVADRKGTPPKGARKNKCTQEEIREKIRQAQLAIERQKKLQELNKKIREEDGRPLLIKHKEGQ